MGVSSEAAGGRVEAAARHLLNIEACAAQCTRDHTTNILYDLAHSAVTETLVSHILQRDEL